MTFHSSGSVWALRASVMAHAHYPSYCGAYFSGLAANRSLFSLLKKYQVMPCHLKANDSLPFTALPALKYVTGSYPFMARSFTGDCPTAMPPHPNNINNTNEKLSRIPTIAFCDFISLYLYVYYDLGHRRGINSPHDHP